MKYIFTIHSHITFLSALGVVEHELLDKDKVIFICSSYDPPIIHNSKISLVKSLDETESKYNILQRILNLNYGKGSDRYISNLLGGENFRAYIDLMSMFNRFLVTHKSCEQFHFIEEGIVNYGNYDSFRLLTMDIDKYSWRISFRSHFKEIALSIYRIVRGRSLKILNLPIHPNLYAFFKGVNFYGFSEFTFPNIPNNQKKVISFSMVLKELAVVKDSKYDLNGAFIWIGDSMCNQYGISMEHFEHALQQLLIKDTSSVKTDIFIKYRGTETPKEKVITENVLKNNNYNIFLLPEDTVMESIFMNYRNLTVFGNGSSLLIYAKIMGHKVSSIFPYIPNIYNIPLASDFDNVHKLLNFKI